MRSRMLVSAETITELEDHLRNQIETFGQKGMRDEDAYLLAVRSIGDERAVREEFDKLENREPGLGAWLGHQSEHTTGRGFPMRTLL